MTIYDTSNAFNLSIAAAGSSALAVAAAGLSAGQWVELTTSNINNVILSAESGAGGVGGNNIAFGNQLGYNSITQKLTATGRDHGTGVPFTPEMFYDIATNTWSVQDSGLDKNVFTHEGGSTAIRPDNGDHYKRSNGNANGPESIMRKPIGGSFATFETSPSSYGQIFVGCAWWPGSNTGHTALAGKGAAGCLVITEIALGQLLLYDPLSTTWSEITTPQTYPDAEYHSVTAYSHVHNCLVYGGGNNSVGGWTQRMFRLNQDGTVTELTTCPVRVGIQAGNIAEDPVSGNIILWGGGSNIRNLWELNPTGAGTWTDYTGTRAPPSLASGGPSDPSGGPGIPDALVSVSLPDHGVIAYISAQGASIAKMHLYKHT